MNYKDAYNSWLNGDCFDEATKAELRAISGDEREIEERFFKTLEFGTGGLRGVIGAGLNRMNFYTVGKATLGLANYILKQNIPNPSVVIAYDSRRFSPEFAKHAALVLAARGVKAYVFDALRPTPELSFAVRELKCTAGIVVTASHNPREYNGYKVYWSDGAQVVPPHDNDIINEVNKIESFADCVPMDEADAVGKGLFEIIGSDIDEKFLAAVKKQSVAAGALKEAAGAVNIVYTPLNGAGNVLVRRVLADMGFTNVFTVPEQELPDPNFTTLKYPNPEDPEAFTLALKLASEKKADIIIATDPDSDRAGVFIPDGGGGYMPISGNMAGVLLCEYIMSAKKKNKSLPKNAAIISTIVSTKLTREIANSYNAAYFEVFTGFKNIGALIKEFEETGSHEYVFGFEESYGYLAGTHARDKDAVVACMLLCEIAAVLKARKKSVAGYLNDIYKKYGYYLETTQSITLKGVAGQGAIKTVMSALRKTPPKSVGGFNVTTVRDYLARKSLDTATGLEEGLALPAADVLYFCLSDGSWFCIRPSGTEPKIKIYIGVAGAVRAEAESKLKDLSSGAMYVINKEIP